MCIRDRLMGEGALSFRHTNAEEIKNLIAEQARNNDKLLDAVKLLEWFFVIKEIDENPGE
jgi:hypothetical protein